MPCAELYVIVTKSCELEGLVARIEHIADRLPLACVLFAFDGDQHVQLAESIKALHQLGWPCLTMKTVLAGADGVHLDNASSLDFEKSDFLIGMGSARDRHQALKWAEQGADYIWFGPLLAEQKNKDALALAAWWAQFVEVPCVLSLKDKKPPTADMMTKAVQTGADYIALSLDQLSNETTILNLATRWKTPPQPALHNKA